jgi:PleD family two-component response regulator
VLTGARLAGATWLLVQHARESDLVGYLGENRFVVVLPHTDLDIAEQVANGIRDSAAGEPLSSLAVTVRTAAILPREGEDAVAVLSRAASLLLEPEAAEEANEPSGLLA